jgi:hypothetical protein
VTPLVLCVGDTVKYVGKDGAFRHNSRHIIQLSEISQEGEVEYATNHGAWFSREDFELVAPATPESLLEGAPNDDDESEEL